MNTIPKSPWSSGHAADFPGDAEKTSCDAVTDDDQFIGYRFQDDGYVTFIAEDWAQSAFNWPNCTGFSKTPVDHYLK